MSERQPDILRRLTTTTGHDDRKHRPEGRIQSTENTTTIMPDPSKHGQVEPRRPETF